MNFLQYPADRFFQNVGMGDALTPRFAVAAMVASMALSAANAPEYPRDFRGWAHVKSAMVTERHPAFAAEGGIHHIYANPKAMAGYSSGNFADGAVIVYELLETSEKNGIVAEGSRRRVDVMVKDAGANPNTGGWMFERFRGEGLDQAEDTAKAKCFDCHSKAQDHGFVFSRVR